MATTAQWPKIYQRQGYAGKTGWIVDCGLQTVNGVRKRHRRSFPTKSAAQTWADEQRVLLRNEGNCGYALSAEKRAEVQKYIATLEGKGASLDEAVDYYVEHVLPFKNAPSINQLLQGKSEDDCTNGDRPFPGLIAEKLQDGLSFRSMQDLRDRLNVFARSFGDRQIHTLHKQEIKTWVNRSEWAANTKRNYMSRISELFKCAIENDWAEVNQMDLIRRPKRDQGTPEFSVIEEVKSLLQHAPAFGYLGYFVLGFFCGPRPEEIFKIPWTIVDMNQRIIVIDESIAKLPSRRIVTINDTAFAWLQQCRRDSGPVVPEMAEFQKL